MEQSWPLNRDPPVPDSAGVGTTTVPRTPEDAHVLALLEHTGTLLWTMPTDGDIRVPNASWLAYTGQRPEEAYGHGWLEAVFPEDRRALLQAVTQAGAAGTSYEATCRLRRFDGAYRTYRVQGVPVRAADGALCEWVCCCTDRTRQQQTEEQATSVQVAQARASEVEAMLEAMPDGVVVYNQEGHIIQFNQTMRTTLAVQAEPDFLTLPLEDRLRRLHTRNAQGVPLPPEQIPQLRLLRGETLRMGEAEDIQMRSLDGREIVFNVAGTPLRDTAGAISGAVLVARDVTEQRRREAELKATARLFEATFEQAAVGIAHVELNGHFLHFNSRMCEITGYRREDLAALNFQAITHPDDLEACLALIGQMLAGEITTCTMDKRYLRPDGSSVWVQLTAALLRSAEGVPERFISVVEDISARKAAEAALVASEARLQQSVARLQAVLEVLPVGVALTDSRGGVQQINQTFKQVWGEEAPLVESVAGYRAYQGWWPDGRPLAPEEWGSARAAQLGEAVLGQEIEIETFHGERKHIHNSAVPIRSPDGALVGTAVALLDVTERKRLERQTREALEALLQMAEVLVQQGTSTDQGASEGQPEVAQVAHQLADLTRVVLGCKRVSVIACAEVSGQLRPLALVGFPPAVEADWFQTVAHFTLSQYVTAPLLQRLEAGEVIVSALTRLGHPDLPPSGGQETLIAPMRLGQQVLGILTLEYDSSSHRFTPTEYALAGAVAKLAVLVLEQERLFREREEARASALAERETARQMSDFLSLVGHELRTPLTSLKGQAQLAQRHLARLLAAEDTLPGTPGGLLLTRLSPLEGKLERILSPIGRLERLIRDLLEAAHLQRGQLMLEARPCDLAEVVSDAIEELRAAWPERAMELQLPEPEEVVVRADAERVGQVVTNYLTNALKYTPPDSPIVVTLRMESEWGWVEVRDHGPGIPIEEQAHLWEQFRRGRGADVQSGKAGGLGLGLYLCKQLIERQGGQVGMESQLGVGSAFWLRLPLVKPPR